MPRQLHAIKEGVGEKASAPQSAEIELRLARERSDENGMVILSRVNACAPPHFLYIKEGVGKQASAPSMQTERSDKLREVEGEGAVECF